MTDFSLMIPTIAISLLIFLLLLALLNQEDLNSVSRSRKRSHPVSGDSYLSNSDIYVDSQHHHSSGLDHSNVGDCGGDYGGHFGGDYGGHFGGFDGGSH